MMPAALPVPIPSWGSWSAADLVAAKAGRRVSVVIPARDEEDTVGAVVAAVRRDWLERTPLVDEVIVIDSDSVDGTAARARAAGAVVFSARDIRPDQGPAEGKGEALWKGLQVSTGDILVFLDADLLEWGTHFVPGLLGPLLLDDQVQLVKAVYDRPMLDELGHEAESGGRVTELVARPLLALHWPALAGIIQPLSGEWAIRRAAFERLSVPMGYGVEIAALIDVAELFGAEAVAQVDLGRRTHRHHRHDTLGPMAVQVLAAVEARLGTRLPAPTPTHLELRQFDRAPTGYVARSRHVNVGERPPAITVADSSAAGEDFLATGAGSLVAGAGSLVAGEGAQ